MPATYTVSFHDTVIDNAVYTPRERKEHLRKLEWANEFYYRVQPNCVQWRLTGEHWLYTVEMFDYTVTRIVQSIPSNRSFSTVTKEEYPVSYMMVASVCKYCDHFQMKRIHIREETEHWFKLYGSST